MDGDEKSLVRCLRLLLEGKISWDHLIEEFKAHGGVDVPEAVELIEEASTKVDRYAKATDIDRGLREKIEHIIEDLSQS